MKNIVTRTKNRIKRSRIFIYRGRKTNSESKVSKLEVSKENRIIQYLSQSNSRNICDVSLIREKIDSHSKFI